jgi:ankyrin repeat protein
MHYTLIKLLAVRWLVVTAASSACLAATPDLRLLDAVKQNDMQLANRLLQERLDVNARYGDGSTALAWAAYKNNAAMADLLIRAGADVNAVNDDGAAPLHLACNNRSAPMVARLLAAGANANAKLLNGETVLMTCARTGEAAAVKALLDHKADPNVKESAHGQTALMWAAAESHAETVRLLIAAGADIRAHSLSYPTTVVGEQTQRSGREKLNYIEIRGGMTPLMFAARDGAAESAKLLLAAGADANDVLPDGMSVLVLAVYSGEGNIAELLLEKGANPNAAGAGYTALHAATLRNDLSLVKALLAKHADPDARMTKGTAIRRSNTDFNLPNTLIGATPYLLAAKFAEPDIMQALVAGGANPGATLPNGATALMLAAGMGSARNRRVAPLIESPSLISQAVAKAVELGADVNAANPAGDTALHLVATAGNDSAVELLANHGANVNAKNKRGETPLMLASTAGGRRAAAAADADNDITGVPAVLRGHPSTVALLRKLGATQ